MDTLKRKRTQLRRNYTALNKKFVAAVEGNKDVEAKFLALSEAAEALFDVEDKVYEAWSESADFVEADFEADQNKALEYRESWAEARTIYNDLRPKQLSRHSSQTSVNSHTSGGSGHKNATGSRNTSLKLPKLELPRFDGETRNWIQFWGQFSKLHDNKDLHDIDKFQYLIQSTVEDSPARQLVTSYPPSAENYAKAVEALKMRFARDEMLIETYVRGLLGLVWAQLKGERCGLPYLYDSLQTHLQALESLKVTKDKFAAILYPMIESALPEDLLRSWNRSRAKYDEVDDELAMLMSFLKSEVESEERISLARQGFSHDDISPPTACFVAGTSKKTDDKMFSATNFTKQCIWCDKDTHSSAECSKATRMTAKERIELAKSKKACLICLKIHVSKECKAHPKCLFCSKRHVTLLCQEIPERTEMSKSENSSSNSDSSNELLCQQSSTTLLKTLAVDLIAGNKEVRVRAFIDPGAQKSYIKKDLAIKLGLKPVRVEKLSHNLFGGVKTSTEEHPVYDVCLKSTCDEFSINLSVLGKEKICGILPKVRSDTLKEHLRLKGIKLTESRDTPDEVTLLIGADFSGKLRTGEFVQFDNHLFAVQTKLGWTIEGPVSGVYFSTNSGHFVTHQAVIKESSVTTKIKPGFDAAATKKKRKKTKKRVAT